MKVSCTLVASVMAASTMALTSCPAAERDVPFNPCSIEGFSSPGKSGVYSGSRASSSSAEKDKFAPKFDGLRFIETLVTAHR